MTIAVSLTRMLYAVLTVSWCAWRWHRLAAEPTVLPAGRLGA